MSDTENRQRRAVVGALVEGDEGRGMTVLAISAWSSVGEEKVREILLSLRAHEEAETVYDKVVGGPPKLSDRWQLTDEGRKGYRDPRFASMQRKCMCCREMFQSGHAGNRICPGCSPPDNEGPTVADEDFSVAA